MLMNLKKRCKIIINKRIRRGILKNNNENIHIINAINGNYKSFEKVINEYIDDMYKFVFLHTKYEEDAMIILKDSIAFMKDNITKLKDSKEFIIWIYTILSINTNNFLDANGMVSYDHNKEFYYKDDKIKLYEAIDLLEEKYKTAIILKYYFNFTINDIAEILNLNVETIFIYIRQGLKEMKISVEENLKYEE